MGEPQVTSRGEDLPLLDVQQVGEPQVIRKSGRRPPTVGRSTGGGTKGQDLPELNRNVTWKVGL